MNYKISEEDYVSVLEQQLKQKRKSPVQLFVFLLSTAGQMLVVCYLILSTHASGIRAAGLAALSVILTALSLVNFLRLRPRAKNYFRVLRAKGKISEEFWKLHTLKLEGEKLSVRFGSISNSCGITQIRVADNKVNAYLLHLGQTQSIFDIVPYSAFGNEKQRAEFPETIHQAAFQCTSRRSY
ncbi:hypothetical protein EQM14_14640 [Caproiciproducens sp. NJN-50]|uniref:hypothetical protein n=1 Tax=Caproiciproducens sp. NJN-50 TaxID=2507162 RepID=UPI000FFE2D4E|nr:hypothetical protein [Caproiciproducens sp. NJN-50]QAT50906.1 hypothetical protein EQM14_14640 [Caproiciproducens sp. NJN-50]